MAACQDRVGNASLGFYGFSLPGFFFFCNHLRVRIKPFLWNNSPLPGLIRRVLPAVVFALGLSAKAPMLRAADEVMRLESAGARYGFSAFGRTRHFQEGDVFAEWVLPYHWELGKDFSLNTQLSASAGFLERPGYSAGIFTGGPELLLKKENFPVFLEGGVIPAFVSREDFGTVRLGGFVQFSTHVSLNWEITHHVRAFYRFQHVSNGGLRIPNPGLNFHMFGASYVF